ncbi:hypothetical protein C8R45DRAFT_1104005 [Mycena sanguinolenta]|nr:hypothetical protein C8R45DRAFT_1115828 [Mycena sanguinolenta]KAJ6472553.1 hypothetical protein C8R45DRAFT_1104005 [Mycena sanguinolenta]
MFSEFPQELVDATIDCVDPLDHYGCALVAKSWLPRSQSHIFRTISLGVCLQGGHARGLIDMPPLEGQFNNFSAFWKLLENSPHLAEYVHNLEMGLSVPSTELVGSPEILAPASWKAIEDMVVAFLPMLNKIDSLALFPCGPNTFHTLDLSERLSNLFAALPLRSLSLCQWLLPSYPPNSIFQSGLLSLQFIHCQFRLPAAPMHLSSCMTALTSLELNGCDRPDLFYQNWVPQHNWRVDDMTIELWNEENMAMRALHRIALGVLKSLTIILSGNVDHTPFFELSSLSHIPTLHLLFDGNRIGQATVTTWLQAAMGDHAQFTTTLYNLQLSNPTLYLQTDETYFSSSSGDAYLRERTYISVQDR